MNPATLARSLRPLLALLILLLIAGCDDSSLTRVDTGSDALSSVAGKKGTSAACLNRANNTIEKLIACVTLDGVRTHQAALQAIADANGGSRAAGSPGFDASVDYVVERLESAGYDVILQSFDFEFIPPSVLQQTAPIQATYETGRFTGSGDGTIDGQVIAVDLALGTAEWPTDPAFSTSGCEANDFAGLDFSGPADIALIQRGACLFSTKAANAEAAGAEAVILFNQGDNPNREGLIVGNAATLPGGSPSNLQIPVVGASFFQGIALAVIGAQAYIQVDPMEIRTNENILAELPGRNGQNVIVVGGYLDTVPDGPGINDNGSGSAAILETALHMAKVQPWNTVRFAWWGASELNLIGSDAYVSGLTQQELDAIALYLDFSIIGSPNYVRFVLDGDGSDSPVPAGAYGAASIEKFFQDFYADRGLASEVYPLFSLGVSNYAAFYESDIPIGGVTTGGFEIKTPEQSAIYGGVAGEQLDPCIHLACDTYDNVSLAVLDLNSDAVAASTLTYAMSTDLVNGTRGKGNFKYKPSQDDNAPTE